MKAYDAEIVPKYDRGKSVATHQVHRAVSVIGTCPHCGKKSKYMRSIYKACSDVDARCSNCAEPYVLPALKVKS